MQYSQRMNFLTLPKYCNNIHKLQFRKKKYKVVVIFNEKEHSKTIKIKPFSYSSMLAVIDFQEICVYNEEKSVMDVIFYLKQ